nr:TPA_asm: hypothetical protein HUJ06_004728 [Nelumbo nucifera]
MRELLNELKEDGNEIADGEFKRGTTSYDADIQESEDASSPHSQEEMQQKYMGQNNIALELISNVIGVDKEGHAHQQILSYAVKRLQRLFKLDDNNLLNCILASSPMQIYFRVLE